MNVYNILIIRQLQQFQMIPKNIDYRKINKIVQTIFLEQTHLPTPSFEIILLIFGNYGTVVTKHVIVQKINKTSFILDRNVGSMIIKIKMIYYKKESILIALWFHLIGKQSLSIPSDIKR